MFLFPLFYFMCYHFAMDFEMAIKKNVMIQLKFLEPQTHTHTHMLNRKENPRTDLFSGKRKYQVAAEKRWISRKSNQRNWKKIQRQEKRKRNICVCLQSVTKWIIVGHVCELHYKLDKTFQPAVVWIRKKQQQQQPWWRSKEMYSVHFLMVVRLLLLLLLDISFLKKKENKTTSDRIKSLWA